MATAASTRTVLRSLAHVLSPAAGRTPGEWAVDIVLFVVAVAYWQVNGSPLVNPQIAEAWWPFDRAIGAVACLLLWWSRRYPLTVGALMIVPSAVAITSAPAVLIGVYRMGLLGRLWIAALITLVNIALALPYHAIAPIPGLPWEVWVVILPLLYALTFCIGLLGRARRQQLVNLRHTAASDRERYEEQLASIRRDERDRIAREMHDVLAHRMSLLSVHAGALEYRATSPTPLTPEEIREATGVIRHNASEAVEDLRKLLGLLRSDDALGTGTPQSRLSNLPALIHDVREAGQRVEFRSDVEPGRVRESTERTVFRVVQEALTNARKHSATAIVSVRLEQREDAVVVTAANPVPPGTTNAELTTLGNGLIGLDERVRIDGGTFQTGVADGRFTLVATLPVGPR